jgi:two-component system response regulator PilR (NtrC family)
MSKKILGSSPPVKAMLNLIARVAPTKTNILIIGESGTGKELVARMIHDSGPLKDKPFICVNCGAIPETLIESEMFGHKRGSFTGAIADKPGLFQAADSGTLFLDEVGELPMSMQVKLLRAIQERVIRRVGGNEDMKIDVRIIAATNRDLEAAVAGGTFREDLYYRLNVILIKTPPLRDRPGDIAALAEQFALRIATKYHKKIRALDPDTLQALERYDWPGNVRELENVIERAITLENGESISLSALPAQIQAKANGGVAGDVRKEGSYSGIQSQNGEIRLPAPDFSKGSLNLDGILGDVERTYLNAALEHSGGVKKKAAELLGITFRSIRYRLKKLGVETLDTGDAGDGGDGDLEEK